MNILTCFNYSYTCTNTIVKMDYYCDVCEKFIKPRSKYEHFKSNTHKEFDKCKHMELTIENPNIDYIDEKFYAYIIKHNKKI